MILDVYKDAFEYSAQDWTALVKLGVINVLGMFIFLPLFLISGYNYRVIKIGVKGMINGEDELPEFDEWVNMFVDGIKVFIVEFAYALIPIVLFFAVLFSAASIGGNAGGIVMALGMIVAIVLFILLPLMGIIGVANMAENDDKFSAAFDINGIIEIIKSIGWLNTIATWIGVQIIVGVISIVVFLLLYAILMFLGLSTAMVSSNIAGGVFGIGFILIIAILCFLVTPYLSIFQSRVYGLLYNLQ